MHRSHTLLTPPDSVPVLPGLPNLTERMQAAACALQPHCAVQSSINPCIAIPALHAHWCYMHTGTTCTLVLHVLWHSMCTGTTCALAQHVHWHYMCTGTTCTLALHVHWHYTYRRTITHADTQIPCCQAGSVVHLTCAASATESDSKDAASHICSAT